MLRTQRSRGSLEECQLVINNVRRDRQNALDKMKLNFKESVLVVSTLSRGVNCLSLLPRNETFLLGE